MSRVFPGLFVLLALVMILASPAEAARKKIAARTKAVDKYAAIVVEADSGRVLYDRYADKPLYPASLTKMMTLYLTFEALDAGRITKNQRIWVSSHAASMAPSKLGLQPDTNIRVEDAILALVTKSANDAAVALAESLGGTESRFARLMTEKAAELGMEHTVFKNASGLHDRGQFSTARDMAILSRALIVNYPRHYRYFSTKSFTYAGVTYSNHNKLMYSYEGMDGIKTGYVEPSGFNLAASVARDGKRLIGVVFGGKTATSRNIHMAALLNDSFAKLSDAPRIALADTAPRLPVPVKKPVNATTMAYALATPGSGNPDFNSMMGLLVDQGEGDIDPDTAKNAMAKTTAGVRNANSDAWAVQLGAFSDQAAGQKALQKATNSLPYNLRRLADPKLVPLETSRGVIYRARLAGMTHAHAANTCRILSGNCLVLAEQ